MTAINHQTLHLLVLQGSPNEAERLAKLFRNAGHITRQQYSEDLEDLEQALAQKNWDLLIFLPASEQEPLLLSEVMRTLHTLNHGQLPVIQLLEEADDELAVEALREGARDALPQGMDQHLILAARRELQNLHQQRTLARLRQALLEADRRCSLLLKNSTDAIAYIHDGMHIHANHAYLELFGYPSADDLAGMPLIDLIFSSDQEHFKRFFRNYMRTQGEGELQCQWVQKNGSAFKSHVLLSPATYDGEPCIQILIQPQNEEAEMAEKLRELSLLDQTTNLPNRTHCVEEIEQAVQQTRAQSPLVLAFLRIDRFIKLQAEIGFSHTDTLVAILAQLIRQHLPEDTYLARFGDDQFALLQTHRPQTEVEQECRVLLQTVAEHLFDIDDRTVRLTLSIGIAQLGGLVTTATGLIERAHRTTDAITGGNCLQCYDPAVELANEANKGNLLPLLRQALENEGFRLLFQPTLNLHGDPAHHYEVFLRLLDPESAEALLPKDFMAAAAQSGLTTVIDRWVIVHAIKQLLEHRANKQHPTRLFLHLSAASLQDDSLLPWLKSTLEAANLPPSSLVFEIEEKDLSSRVKRAMAFIEGLQRLQCKVACTRFASGDDALNLLRHLSVDFVKLDRRHTQDLVRPEQQEALRQLVGELRQHPVKIMVPFVESATVLSILWQMGVDYIQGYYLQAPSPSMDYDFGTED